MNELINLQSIEDVKAFARLWKQYTDDLFKEAKEHYMEYYQEWRHQREEINEQIDEIIAENQRKQHEWEKLKQMTPWWAWASLKPPTLEKHREKYEIAEPIPDARLWTTTWLRTPTILGFIDWLGERELAKTQPKRGRKGANK